MVQWIDADEEAIERFMAAVAAGAVLFAHPETARQMRGYGIRVRESRWIAEGTVVAANFQLLGDLFTATNGQEERPDRD